jgi:transposase
VVFEDADWREMVTLPAADAEGIELRTTNHRIAAVGRLRQFVREKAGEYQEVDRKHTTKRCHACGSVEDFDAARELEHSCSACGEIWDQDYGAAKNLLRAFQSPAMSV